MSFFQSETAINHALLHVGRILCRVPSYFASQYRRPKSGAASISLANPYTASMLSLSTDEPVVHLFHINGYKMYALICDWKILADKVDLFLQPRQVFPHVPT